MKSSNWLILAVAALIIAVVAYFMIDVDQTQEAKLPDVDVTVEGGQTPEFEVKTGKVEVGTEEKTVLVPKVVLEEETVDVPTVDVTPAAE